MKKILFLLSVALISFGAAPPGYGQIDSFDHTTAGIADWVNEIPEVYNTEMTSRKGYQVVRKKLKAVDLSMTTNADSWLTFICYGGTPQVASNGTISLVNASNMPISINVNPDGSILSVVTGPAPALMEIAPRYLSDADKVKLATFTYYFQQKADNQLTSMSAACVFDGNTIYNNTWLDRVPWYSHPVLPFAHSFKWEFWNGTYTYWNGTPIKAMPLTIIARFNGSDYVVTVDEPPLFSGGFDPPGQTVYVQDIENFIHIEYGPAMSYNPGTNTVTVNPTANYCEARINFWQDPTNKMESDDSPVIALKL